MIKRYIDNEVLDVIPSPTQRIVWMDTVYRIKVDVNPNYADDNLDFPITLSFENGDLKPCQIEMEVGDAEQIAKALLMAVRIRRKAVAKKAAENKEES